MKKNTTLKTIFNHLLLSAAGLAVAACAGSRDPHFAILGQSQGYLSTPVNNKVDILWVIRNAGLMGPMQANLATSINSFMSQFVTKNFDFRIAVVTTDIRAVDPLHPNDPNFSGQAACIVGTPPIILPTTPTPVLALAANSNVGFFGASDSHGLDAIHLALSAPNLTGCNAGFLRPDAYLAVIEFSDVDDDTVTVPATTVTFLDALKPPTTTPSGSLFRPYSVSGIIVPNAASQAVCDALGNTMFSTVGQTYTEVGNKFISIATQTGGQIADICAADFSAGLLAIGKNILEQASALYLVTTPDQSTIVVIEGGTILANNAINGWTYNSANNTIVLHGSAIPTSSSVSIIVNYTPTDIIR